jgi:hypothetical protein
MNIKAIIRFSVLKKGTLEDEGHGKFLVPGWHHSNGVVIRFPFESYA